MSSYLDNAEVVKTIKIGLEMSGYDADNREDLILAFETAKDEYDRHLALELLSLYPDEDIVARAAPLLTHKKADMRGVAFMVTAYRLRESGQDFLRYATENRKLYDRFGVFLAIVDFGDERFVNDALKFARDLFKSRTKGVRIGWAPGDNTGITLVCQFLARLNSPHVEDLLDLCYANVSQIFDGEIAHIQRLLPGNPRAAGLSAAYEAARLKARGDVIRFTY